MATTGAAQGSETTSVNGMVIATAITDIGPNIGNRITMRSPFTFRRLCTMNRGNRPASVYFSRSIFVTGRKRAHGASAIARLRAQSCA
jgi:hypothetical protein